jgi:putative effector of murein hydrolase
VILLHTPLFWAGLTIAAFIAGQQLYRISGNLVFLPPILTAIVLVIVCIEGTDTSYATYMEGGRYLHDLLGPVIVMLAVPLYQQIHAMRAQWLRILMAVTLGSGTTLAVAWGMSRWLLEDPVISTTLLTKSITTPVAVAIVSQIGGDPALASAFVIVTGILGAVMIVPILTVMRMNQPQTLGLTLGVCAHAIGTGRALELGPQASAYAAMAMTLTATLHALVIPLLMR